MIHTIVHGVAVNTHGTAAPTAHQWQSYLEALRNSHGGLRAVIIYSLGGGPSGRQRTALAKVLREVDPLPSTFVFTDSRLMRGIVTAVGWFLPRGRQARVYAPSELHRVLAQLDITAVARQAIEGQVHADVTALTAAQRRSG